MGEIKAAIVEICDNEMERTGEIPGLFLILDACERYGYAQGTVCNVYYEWRRSLRSDEQLAMEWTEHKSRME